MSGDFSNKVAVVTGGSRGIGREIALEFTRSGAQTVIVSSSADNLSNAAKTIASAGLAPLTIAADLRTLEGCQQAFDAVRDKFNRCDILVCSAGATRAGNFTETARPGLDRRLRIKVFRLRAHVPAVLANAQGGPRLYRQHWRGRCALPRR